MKERNEIWNQLLKSERKARSGKFTRLLRTPILYPSLMIFNQVLYPLLKRGIYYKTDTFFGLPIRTLLPSGTDIVLNKIKSHDSEIRLSKYLTKVLQPGDVFVDVGAHYGYYSLLASALVGNIGRVYGIEASQSSYNNLKENVESFNNIQIFHAAAGDKPGMVTFFEYPGPYAEYNTTVPGAYIDQKWFRHVKQTVNTVPILLLDDLFINEKINAAILKIDVEGGESSVLRGLTSALREKQLTIAMEYLSSTGPGSHHREAADILYKAGYQSYSIASEGELIPVSLIDKYLADHKLNSDNIIFKKGELGV